jgi:hypothetical protein
MIGSDWINPGLTGKLIIVIMLPESPETILRFRRGRPQAKPVDTPLSTERRGTGGGLEIPGGAH